MQPEQTLNSKRLKKNNHGTRRRSALTGVWTEKNRKYGKSRE